MYLGQKLLGFHMRTYIGPDEVVKTYMNVLAQNGMTIALKMKFMLLITILLSCMENIVGHIATGKSFIADFVTFISLMRTIRLRSLFKLWTVQLLMRY